MNIGNDLQVLFLPPKIQLFSSYCLAVKKQRLSIFCLNIFVNFCPIEGTFLKLTVDHNSERPSESRLIFSKLFRKPPITCTFSLHPIRVRGKQWIKSISSRKLVNEILIRLLEQSSVVVIVFIEGKKSLNLPYKNFTPPRPSRGSLI